MANTKIWDDEVSDSEEIEKNYAMGLKEESVGKKVYQFWEIFMWERESCTWFSHLSGARGEILE